MNLNLTLKVNFAALCSLVNVDHFNEFYYLPKGWPIIFPHPVHNTKRALICQYIYNTISIYFNILYTGWSGNANVGGVSILKLYIVEIACEKDKGKVVIWKHLYKRIQEYAIRNGSCFSKERTPSIRMKLCRWYCYNI